MTLPSGSGVVDVRIEFPPRPPIALAGTACLIHTRWSFWCWWGDRGCRIYFPEFDSAEMTVTFGRRKGNWKITEVGPGQWVAKRYPHKASAGE